MVGYSGVLVVVWLFVLDRTRRPMTSSALWIALVWWMIVASRPVTQWFGGSSAGDDNLEGSPVDAAVYLVLLVLAILVLQRRGVRLGSIIGRNRALFALMLFWLLSVAWSDYPIVSLKRWVKDCGNIAVVLLIATDPNPLLAARALLARLIYLTVPASFFVIRYWPDVGRYYDKWTWTASYSGIAAEKNALGAIAMVSCIFLLWDALFGHRAASASTSATDAQGYAVLQGRRTPMDYVYFAMQAGVFGMSVWLLDVANSSNALVCTMVGVAAMIVLSMAARGHAGLLKHLGVYTTMTAFLVGAALLATDGTDIILESLGEDATLTGRTAVWLNALALTGNSLIGAGYQGFWIGRLGDMMQASYVFHINQAHNGYIQTYLDGGWIGVLLLAVFLVSSLARLRDQLLKRRDTVTLLYFPLMIVVVLYNISEAMFNNLSLMWMIALLAACTNVQEETQAEQEVESDGEEAVKPA